MRSTALAVCLALIAACAPKEEAEAPAAPPAMTVADFAGTWNNVTSMTGAAAPVETQLVGAADGSWSMVIAGRDPVPMQMSVVGDSLIGVSGLYESILRPGVMVSIRTATVRSGDMMTGNVTATYKTPAGDEVVTGTMQSTRAPQ